MNSQTLKIVTLQFIIVVGILMYVASTRVVAEPPDSDLSVLFPIALVDLILGLVVAKFWRGVWKESGSAQEKAQFFSRHLVSLVLIESAAIIGFAMTFMTGDQSSVRVLGGIAILGILAIWPRRL